MFNFLNLHFSGRDFSRTTIILGVFPWVITHFAAVIRLLFGKKYSAWSTSMSASLIVLALFIPSLVRGKLPFDDTMKQIILLHSVGAIGSVYFYYKERSLENSECKKQ